MLIMPGSRKPQLEAKVEISEKTAPHMIFPAQRRVAKGLSVPALAEKAEISPKTIYALETGGVRPERSAIFLAYLDALKITPDEYEQATGIALRASEQLRRRYERTLDIDSVANVPLLGSLQLAYNGKAMRTHETILQLPSLLLGQYATEKVFLVQVTPETMAGSEARDTIAPGSIALFHLAPDVGKRGRGWLEPSKGDLVMLYVPRAEGCVLTQYWPGQSTTVRTYDGSKTLSLTEVETSGTAVGVYLGHWVSKR